MLAKTCPFLLALFALCLVFVAAEPAMASVALDEAVTAPAVETFGEEAAAEAEPAMPAEGEGGDAEGGDAEDEGGEKPEAGDDAEGEGDEESEGDDAEDEDDEAESDSGGQ